jgi:hypothetical protein
MCPTPWQPQHRRRCAQRHGNHSTGEDVPNAMANHSTCEDVPNAMATTAQSKMCPTPWQPQHSRRCAQRHGNHSTGEGSHAREQVCVTYGLVHELASDLQGLWGEGGREHTDLQQGHATRARKQHKGATLGGSQAPRDEVHPVTCSCLTAAMGPCHTTPLTKSACYTARHSCSSRSTVYAFTSRPPSPPQCRPPVDLEDLNA